MEPPGPRKASVMGGVEDAEAPRQKIARVVEGKGRTLTAVA